MWDQHLGKGLKKIGFQPWAADECVLDKGDTMLFCHVDDGMFFWSNSLEIGKCIKDLIQLKNAIEENCDIECYTGINSERKEDNTIKLSQPHLIQQIIDEINMPLRLVDKEIPASSSKTLRRFSSEPKFNNRFHCRKMIGKLNFLEKGTRRDIAWDVHQCVRFCNDHKAFHGLAV